ncbi:hypothetical protein Nepgr_031965 [Nepenthes gracilis]|uniref:Uncharacterized protein n=1 Tax=Nepenthes gracilis TaxID=150966 RepID=A0AAD3TJS4_NEPGR|nr:hypothetical protein Nepgr_031965 [Nepenthes gracilis]
MAVAKGCLKEEGGLGSSRSISDLLGRAPLSSLWMSAYGGGSSFLKLLSLIWLLRNCPLCTQCDGTDIVLSQPALHHSIHAALDNETTPDIVLLALERNIPSLER